MKSGMTADFSILSTLTQPPDFYFASLFEDNMNISSHLLHYCYLFLPLRWRRLASAELLHKLPDTSVRCFMLGIGRSVACLFECTHVSLNVRDYKTQL